VWVVWGCGGGVCVVVWVGMVVWGVGSGVGGGVGLWWGGRCGGFGVVVGWGGGHTVPKVKMASG
jgi:hypothetical protein